MAQLGCFCWAQICKIWSVLWQSILVQTVGVFLHSDSFHEFYPDKLFECNCRWSLLTLVQHCISLSFILRPWHWFGLFAVLSDASLDSNATIHEWKNVDALFASRFWRSYAIVLTITALPFSYLVGTFDSSLAYFGYQHSAEIEWSSVGSVNCLFYILPCWRPGICNGWSAYFVGRSEMTVRRLWRI